MHIAGSDITIVYQGPIIAGPHGTAAFIRLTRDSLPDSRCLLSTWHGSHVAGFPIDGVVFSHDPGSLPGIKSRDGSVEPNNINRQILSSCQGLHEVKTRYAVKIRTDCALKHAGFLLYFLRFQNTEQFPRILTTSLFTIDPLMFEHMPYHLSDWFQFGFTAVLKRYWLVPFMTEQDARYYERHPHARHSTFMDRRFRSRLAVEQHLATHYAKQLGYSVPRYHNDIEPTVMDGHRRFLGRHWIILDPWDLGLEFPKYEWSYQSSFQRLNCLLSIDWYDLYRDAGGKTTFGVSAYLMMIRRMQKRVARLLGRLVDRAGPFFLRPGLKQVVNLLLTILAWQKCRPLSRRSRTNPWSSSLLIY